VNFVNLVTARALRRAREVGMRKACGAGRSALVLQFLGESLIVVLFAACVALAMSEWLMPKLNAFLQTDAALDYWRSMPVAAAMLLGVGLFAAVVGAYPALLLAAFRPARTLKGSVLAPEGGVMVRNVLTGLQFAILVVLVISAIVVFQQRNFATRDAVRADIDRMVIVRGSCLPAFRQELRKLPGVAGVSCTGPSFLDNQQTTSISHRGRPVSMNYVRADPGIFALYGIKLLAGTLPAASEGATDAQAPRLLVLNQTAVRRLGFASPQAAIGQAAGDPAIGSGAPPGRVAAVVPDFAFYSVERAMEATAFSGGPTSPGFDLVSIKLNGREVSATLAAIDRLWSATGNQGPISREFLDEHVRQLYSGMARQGELLAVFAGVAVLLACLGLFGLSVATGERRIKEVGVRKAMGAAVPQVAGLLLWQFSRPVLLANLVAWPVAFWLMRRWLSGFAYHIELQWWVFPAASGAALLLALLTVMGQTIYTARQKPVLALRYE
jgi:putative ABC transport system permease protein